MSLEKRIIRYISLGLMTVIFVITFAHIAYADEIDFSDYSTTYGYEQLGELDDGAYKQELYSSMHEAYEAVWSNAGDYSTEITISSENTGHYVVTNLTIESYGFDADDIMEVHIALMFDNPVFYYIPSTFYTSSYEGEEEVAYVTLVVDEDYNEYAERAILNSLVTTEIEKYKTATSSLTTDYDKIDKVYEMIMENMEYSYDDAGNPSTDAWAHNIIGALQKQEGVCESYAKTFQLIMNYLGHESYIVAGVSYEENHAWNLVELEGNYYYVDATWDDGAVTREYFLKGSTEFEVDHTKNTPFGIGGDYLYELPEISKNNYEKYLEVSYNGGAITKYSSIAAAFADMKDTQGSYVITVPNGYNGYLPSGQWPAVKEITIIGNASVNYYIYATGDVTLNSDVVFKNTRLATPLNYIINNRDLVNVNIGENELTLDNTTLGGYLLAWNVEWGETLEFQGVGVNVLGGEGSVFRCFNDDQTNIESHKIDVDKIIIDAAYVVASDCDITANKLVYMSSSNEGVLPSLTLYSTLSAHKGINVSISEIIIDGISGSIKAKNTFKGTNMSLGNVSGDNILSVSIECVKEEDYPNISIEDSQVDIYFSLYNMRGTTTDFENMTYTVWEDAVEYNGGYLNVGNTALEKVKSVDLSLYNLDGSGEPVKTFGKNIVELCDIDASGNLYRKYNEKIIVKSESVYYIYYQNSAATTVTIPKDVITITGKGFMNCNSIQEVIIPEGLYHIKEKAFVNCGMKEITLPSTLDSLGEYSIGYNYDADADEYVAIEGFKMTFYEGNYAAKTYAQNNGFEYEEISMPKMVTNFGVDSKTDSKVTLTWDASEGADGYILKKQIGHTTYVVATITGGTNTKYTVSGLNVDDKYTFMVCPYITNKNGDKISGSYDVINVYLIPNVTGFTYSARTKDSITLKWNESKGAVGYRVEQYVDGRWRLLGTLEGATNTTSNVKYLREGINYKFRVCAYKKNGSGNNDYGAYTERQVATILSATTGFTYSARTATTVTLKWTRNVNADGYVIEQYKGGKWTVIKTIKSNTTVSHKVTGLSSATSYSFRIRAYKLNGTTKVYSSYANKKIKTLPSTVKNFTYKARTASTVTLKWTKNTSADGYVIQQYKGGKWVTIKTITKNSTLSYKVTGLKPSVSYKFRIRTYEWDNGKKIYASSYTTKSVQTLPSTVKGFTYKTRTKTTITLKWTKNTSADGYVIQQYKGGKWVTIKTVTKNSTVSHKVTGLKKATTYKFRIRTYKKSGSTKLYASYTTKSIKTL